MYDQIRIYWIAFSMFVAHAHHAQAMIYLHYCGPCIAAATASGFGTGGSLIKSSVLQSQTPAFVCEGGERVLLRARSLPQLILIVKFADDHQLHSSRGGVLVGYRRVETWVLFFCLCRAALRLAVVQALRLPSGLEPPRLPSVLPLLPPQRLELAPLRHRPSLPVASAPPRSGLRLHQACGPTSLLVGMGTESA